MNTKYSLSAAVLLSLGLLCSTVPAAELSTGSSAAAMPRITITAKRLTATEKIMSLTAGHALAVTSWLGINLKNAMHHLVG